MLAFRRHGRRDAVQELEIENDVMEVGIRYQTTIQKI